MGVGLVEIDNIGMKPPTNSELLGSLAANALGIFAPMGQQFWICHIHPVSCREVKIHARFSPEDPWVAVPLSRENHV